MASLRAIIEGIVFAADKPVTEERLFEVLEGTCTKEDITKTLDEIKASYDSDDRPIALMQVSRGYQFRTKPDIASYIRKFFAQRPQRLTQATLETLSIVAYRQPVTRHQIDKIRGVDSGPLLRTLLEKKLVRVIGRSESPGRPILYGTTKEFLEFFALPDLASLPSLRDMKDLGTAQKELILEEIKDDPILSEQTRALFERSEFMESLSDPNLTLDSDMLRDEIRSVKVETPLSALVKEEEAVAHAEIGNDEALQPQSADTATVPDLIKEETEEKTEPQTDDLLIMPDEIPPEETPSL